MSNGKDQSTNVQRAQFVAAPGPGPTQEQLAEMPSAQLPPPAAPGYSGPSDARLADLRARYAQEFQSNPDLARKLMASMKHEVGEEGPDMQQGYVEGVLNRAAIHRQSVDDTISSDHAQWYGTGASRHLGYYDHRTILGLGDQFPPEELSDFQGVIHNAMQGSNVSGYSTGNESGTLRNGTIVMTGKPQKEQNRLVIEPGKDQEWADGITKTPPKATLFSQPPAWTPGSPLGSGPDIVRPPQYQNPPVNSTTKPDITQADEPDDTDDPAYHWPEA